MQKQRLDKELQSRGLVNSRSQAENIIKLGHVTVNGITVTKPGYMVDNTDKFSIKQEKYVSRAAYKLESVAHSLKIDFKDKVVLDVGSSTGGFTDYALKQGAKKVYAVDVGTDQLHPKLRSNERIVLREKTDIRDINEPFEDVDITVIDVSFISLKEVLPHVKMLTCKPSATVLAMCKPQFEAGEKLKTRGVVKNDRMRREILKDFEAWAKQYFVIEDKADSKIAGTKGNLERFYKLIPIK